MRPTSFDPSCWASTSTGTTTRSPERSTVNSSVLPAAAAPVHQRREVGDGRSTHCDDPVPDREASTLGRAAWLHRADLGRHGRVPELEPEARQQCAGSVSGRGCHDSEWRGPGRAVGRTNLERDGAASINCRG